MTCRSISLIPTVVLLAMTLAGCGGDGGGGVAGPDPMPSPAPPPPPVRTLIRQGSSSELAVGRVRGFVFDTSAVGTIDGRVDWTFDDNYMAVFIGGRCPGEVFTPELCHVQASADGFAPKPKTIMLRNASPGEHILWVANRGPRQESISFQLFFTTEGPAGSVRSMLKSSAEVEIELPAGGDSANFE